MWKLQLLRLLQQLQKTLLLPAAVQASSTCRCHNLKLRYSNIAQPVHHASCALLDTLDIALSRETAIMPLYLACNRCMIAMHSYDAILHMYCVLGQHSCQITLFLLLQGGTQHLSQLLHRVAMSHMHHAKALLVGYTMKPSRERNLASRGLLPLTAPHDLCFVPIDFALPLEQQGPFDILLHKVQYLWRRSAHLRR